MKNPIKYLLFLFLQFFLLSCDKEDNQLNDQNINLKSSLFTAADYEYIGEQHNILLDYYFQEILKTDDLTDGFAVETIYGYIDNHYDTTIEDKDLAFNLINEVFQNGYSEIASFYSDNDDRLSLSAKSYLDDLYNIFDSNVGLSQTIGSIENLEATIERDINISNKERMILFSGTNTAKYSLSYWNENGLAWYNINNRENPEPEPEGFWGSLLEVGRQDAYGAIGGAVGAAAVNIIPGAGQVAYGTAIVGTGVANSVVAGLNLARR